jgi:hypothetical protein
LVATVGLSVLLALTAGTDAVAATSPTTKALRSLVRQTKALPSIAAPAYQRRRLVRFSSHALASARARPCVAVADLTRYRGVLGRIHVKSGRRYLRANQRLAALGPASLRASRLLLADKRTKRCGGGVAPSTRPRTKVAILSSDAEGMKVQVALPALRFVPRTGGGHAWTQLVLPNTDAPSRPGTPGIPIASRILGVPDGAELSVVPGTAVSYTLQGVDVFPAQEEPVDADGDEPRPDFTKPPFAEPPFSLDEEAYATDRLIPAKPAMGAILGTARDLVIGNLQVPAAQYNAADRKLKVLNSVIVNVSFEGGPHTFSGELGSPWEHAQRTVARALLNRDVIHPGVFDPVRPCGEEMLVITNAATRPAADQFAIARRAAGLRTSVFETGSVQVGTTAIEIQSFIRSRLTAVRCIHPSYVTIMGDDDLVPTFTGAETLNGIPSDLPYSMRDNLDELPDVAVGRIIGNDQAAIANAVTKIIGYETTVPTTAFMRHATIAAQFQDDDNDGRENRTFIQFAETVRNGLVNRGVSVDRIYADSPTANPLKFNDGTDLPAALLKPTFAWDGDGADVTAAWNAGRFLVIHRDHGWSDGWGHPGFSTSNVDALTNGSLLPVLMSINCSSGAYDYDETSFAGNALVKPDGGAVGVFGDTRDSPSWHNTQIALGFVDALLPSVLPTEGPATTQRVGNALIHGKLRLAGLASPLTDGSTRNELYLWHYFGDPSMQMWGGGHGPFVIDPALLVAVYEALDPGPNPGPPPYQVNVTFPAVLAGQTISLLREGQVIGKAIAGPGSVTIPVTFGDNAVEPGDLQVALEADGAQPVSVPVEGVTKLTQNCPTPYVSTSGTDKPFTVTGQLEPAFANAAIQIVYTTPDGKRIEKTAMTNTDGNWTNTINPAAEANKVGGRTYGAWTVQSFFNGDDDDHAASQTAACTVQVND